MDFSTQQLRQQILSLAIQGKLVPQIAKEGNAKDLLQKIEAERKKSNPKYKPLPVVTDEEKPFEIPESWEWVRLSEIVSTPITDGTHQTPTYTTKEDGVPFISSKDVTQKRIDWSNIKYITKELHEELYKRVAPQKDDILLAKNGTTGVAALVEDDKVFDIYVTLAVIRTFKNLIYPRFLWNIINSSFCKNQFNHSLKGEGVPNLHLIEIQKTIIPLPPLSEQKRIVEKLEVLLGELDTIEQTKEQIEHYAEQLQGQILQTAIQGKLVPQIASEGNAQDLLQKIEAERKKSNPKYKPLPPVTDEEKPFEIPESWVWCRIGDLFSHSAGKQLSGKGGDGKPYKYITTSNLYWGRFELDHLKEMNFTNAELERCSAHKGDLLVCEGGDIGRSAIWNYDYDIRLQNHVHRLRPIIEKFCVKFFYFIMYFYKNTSVIGGKGIGIQGLSANTLKNISVPLPPLSEQKRIVAKLEELLGEVEKLKR